MSMHSSKVIPFPALEKLDSLKSASDWEAIIKLTDEFRDEFGPVPELLFRSGFASASLSDFRRAHRLMADALLAEFNADWVPWLATVYDKLGLALPMWVLAYWLHLNQPSRGGVPQLYERARGNLSHELALRGLVMPAAASMPISFDMAHKYNVRMVEHLQQGAIEQALEVGEAARLFYPDYQPLLVNLGIAYKRANKFNEAGLRCLHALAVDPLGGGVISNFGSLLIAAGSEFDASTLLEAGAMLFRNEASIWSNLAIAFNNMKVAPWEAEMAARRAIELDGNMAASWSALAGTLSRQGRMAESLKAAKVVGELDPLRKNESLFNLNYSETLTLKELSDAHLEAAELRFGRYYRTTKFKNSKKVHEKLNIGFVSGDLIAHPVAYFIDPILQRLHEYFNVFVYHNRPSKDEDEVTSMIKSYDLSWCNVSSLSDIDLCDKIESDKIDILVDLSGHSAYHRLPVFAMRAAPVQVTYLGYPNTTGLKSMDYFIAHDICAGDNLDRFYTEKIYRMHTTGMVYSPLVKSKSDVVSEKYRVIDTPALKNGYVTFGTLNNIAKISDRVISVWCEILNKLVDSRIMIESPGFHQREFVRNFRQRFTAFGVEGERVILKNRDNSLQYIRYNEIDVALDPFPFCGGTTTCDALWMGVPLVTLKGDTLMSRTGASLLSVIGKEQWVARTISEYVDTALFLASDIQRLNEIRLAMRGVLVNSPLMDYDRFAGNLAMAFRDIWSRHLAASMGAI